MRTIADLPEAIRAEYPYSSKFVSVNGWRMHYIDEGPRDATPVLLLHGNPSWGFLYRGTVKRLLAAGYRVIVPDQIGFGLSEKPHDHYAHTLDNHTANIVALMDKLALDDAAFVLQDWGGPTGLGAMLTRPGKVKAVAIMSTWAWASPSSDFHRRIVPWRLMHAPLIGSYLLGKKAVMPGRGMYLSVVKRAEFLAGPQAAYTEVLGDPDERALTWTWPRSIPIGLDSDITKERFAWLEAGVKALKLPSTIIWGREDEVFPHDVFAKKWHELWPHAEGTHFVTGKHFVQEDSGPEIGTILVEFLGRVLPAAKKASAS